MFRKVCLASMILVRLISSNVFEVLVPKGYSKKQKQKMKYKRIYRERLDTILQNQYPRHQSDNELFKI